MKWLGKFKRLRNADHASYCEDFRLLIPDDVYKGFNTELQKYIEAEGKNLGRIRKNRVRDEFHIKVKHLRSVFSALRIMVVKEADLGSAKAKEAIMNFDVVFNKRESNYAYHQSAKAFMGIWGGTNSPTCDALIKEIKSIIAECDILKEEMAVAATSIVSIDYQVVNRYNTDRLMEHIIKKADCEIFELSEDDEAQLARRRELLTFLAGVAALCARVKNVVSNYGDNVVNTDDEGEYDDEEEDDDEQSPKDAPNLPSPQAEQPRPINDQTRSVKTDSDLDNYTNEETGKTFRNMMQEPQYQNNPAYQRMLNDIKERNRIGMDGDEEEQQ